MNPNQFSFSLLWQAAGWTMLQFLWIGGLAALAAGLSSRALRRASPSVKYAVTLVQFTLLALVPWCLLAWKLDHATVVAIASPVAAADTIGDSIVPVAGNPALDQAAPAVAPAVDPERSALADADAGDSLASDRPSAPQRDGADLVAGPARPALPNAPAAPRVAGQLPTDTAGIVDLLPWVWIVGFPLTSLYLLAGIAGAERFRRQCRVIDDERVVALCRRLQALLRLSGQVALGVSDSIAAPILVGIVRPLILLPAAALVGLSAIQLEMILLHELAHVRRWDNLVNLLQRTVEAVLFFHPAVWWLSNRLRLEREHCCDEIVLAHVGRPQEYAEILAQIALSEPRIEGVLASTISQQLMPRIRRILRQEDERMQVSRSLAAVALSLLAGLVLVSIAPAPRELARAAPAPPSAVPQTDLPEDASERPEDTAEALSPQKPLTAEERARFISIQGTVLGTDGKPARWSKVWLLGDTTLPGGRYGAMQIKAGRADADGRFAFRHPRWRRHNPEAGEHAILWILARTRNGAFTRNLTLNLTREYRDKLEIHGLELPVLPRADYGGRIVDRDGSPIRGAKVTPVFLVLPPPEGERVATMPWPREIGAEYTAVTDAQGRFKLVGLPQSNNIVAQIATPALGTREMYWPTDREPELRIEPGGTIRGKLINRRAAELSAHLELTVSSAAPVGIAGPEPGVLYATRFRVEPDGSFEIGHVPAGPCRVQIAFDRGGPPFPRSFFAPVQCQVKSEEITDDVELALPEVIAVRGTVVDRDSGEAIAGAGVLFNAQSENARQWVCGTMTNASGEYLAFVEPGKIAVEYGSAPDGYLTPIQELQSVAEDRTEDFDGPKLLLERAIKLHGRVVDAEGRGVAGAEIRTIQPLRVGQSTFRDDASDRAGEFVIPQLDPEEPLPLRVRSGTAASRALVVPPEHLGEYQQIVIAPENAFRLKGTLVDEAGAPVSGAEVSVHWHRSFVSKKTRMSGLGGQLERHTTDERGRFESGPLWADDGYHVAIAADGFSKTDLPTVTGKSGAYHDYGSVRLTGTGRAISGRVVDPNGRPITGATVFNSGDAPGIVTTQTAEDGHFRLEGLRSGRVYVFAEHDGFRFAGAYTQGKSEQVALTLTPLSEPPPRRQAGDFDALEALRAQQGAELLAWITTAPSPLRPNLRDSKFAALAKTDPDEALKQIARQLPAMDYRSAVLLARSLTPFLPRKKGAAAANKKTVEAALKFVECAVSRIGDLDPRRRTFAKADAGLMFLRLGDAERGKPLVEAAAEDWSRDPPPADSPYSHTVVTIAQGLAWSDVPRALRYIETVSDEFRKSQIRSRVIIEVSKFDVPRALALLRDPQFQPARDNYNDALKFDLAYRIGAVDPQQAAELVRSIGNPRTKAEACGWTAAAIGDENPELARALIDEGLASLYQHRRPSPDAFYYEYVPGVGANLALQAAQIKHPEIESIIQRVMALRIPLDTRTSSVSRLQSTVTSALFLAFVDPTVAKRLLVDLEPQVAGLLGNGGSGSVGRREWLYAWVLADPEHAAALLRGEIEKLGGAGEKAQPPLGVMDALTLMFLPPTERLDFVRQFSSANVVSPYRE